MPDLLLTILASAALVASTIVTFALGAGTKWFTMRTPSGPDSMGIIVFFFGQLLAWGLTLIGAWLTTGRGGFVWLIAPAPAAGIVLFFLIAALAFVGVLAMGASLSNNLKRRTLYGWLGAFLLPVATNAFIEFLALADPAMLAKSLVLRIAAIPFGLIAAAAAITAIVLLFKSQARSADRLRREIEASRARDEQYRVEAIEREAAHKAELEALPDQTPLTVFVTHLFIDKSAAHQRLALARIASLPDLADRFTRELEHPEPLQREYLLNYFRMADALPAPLTESLRPVIARCFVRLAEDFDRAAAEGRAATTPHIRGMTLGLLHSAAKFAPTRFEDGARVLRDAATRLPDNLGAGAAELLDNYLAGQELKD